MSLYCKLNAGLFLIQWMQVWWLQVNKVKGTSPYLALHVEQKLFPISFCIIYSYNKIIQLLSIKYLLI